MDVRIKRLDERAVIPQYAHGADAGFDLVALEDVEVLPGQTVKVRTGIAIEVPAHYALLVVPRSGISLHTKLRVSNAPGVVDSGYSGEICVLVDNVSPVKDEYDWDDEEGALDDDDSLYTGPLAYTIAAGERIAQAVIVPIVKAQFIEVSELGDTERGDGGFGSSGV